jgi:hypothetical protein
MPKEELVQTSHDNTKTYRVEMETNEEGEDEPDLSSLASGERSNIKKAFLKNEA